MVDLNIQLPDSFFQEEVRSGYLVSAQKKAVWAVQLDLLNEFDRVCQKHNLKYIIEFGTLLGAIRHKGFIPWDVDIDVSMLREDYDKLIEIGPTEFSQPYFLQNQFTDKGYDAVITRLRRSDTTALMISDILHRNKFNQGIYLDIDVFDNVPTDDIQYVSGIHNQCKQYCEAIGCLAHRPSGSGTVSDMTLLNLLRYGKYRIRYGSLKNVYKKLEETSRQFGDSEYVSVLFCAMVTKIRPRAWFENTIYVPFENLMLPAPAAYEDVLTSCYGDWRTPIVDDKSFVLFFDTDRSYSDVIGEDGFYERFCQQYNIDIKKYQMSTLEYIKLLGSRIRRTIVWK